jgi:transcriptional regulator with XRE-family HTH domain
MQLTRRRLAQLANIDPSYVTLIERYGYVPRKSKVMDLARALRVDTDRTLIMAGYAPEGVPLSEFLEHIEIIAAEKSLDTGLRDCMKELHTLTKNDQKRAASILSRFLQKTKQKVGSA